MEDLVKLSELLKSQNLVHNEISQIIKRPALAGHLVEFIAAKIFDIELNKKAAQKGMDGYFRSGSFAGSSVI